MKQYDWNNISTKDKEEINKVKPIFIFGPRDISKKRIEQLSRQLGAKKNVLWGILKDEFIPGMEGSPQFRSLELKKLGNLATLQYYQRDAKYILKELKFSAAIFVSGSYHRLLHLREEFWFIERSKIPYKVVSSFTDEKEAKRYYGTLKDELKSIGKYSSKKRYSEAELMKLANEVAERSFDNSAQVGAVLSKKGKVLLTAHNVVVPYETKGMHLGYEKEKNFSPVNDQNHYDTNHAEMELIIEAGRKGIDLKDTELYIPLMPCPACARAISRTDISKVIYSHDHSDGYAAKLFGDSGKKIERLI